MGTFAMIILGLLAVSPFIVSLVFGTMIIGISAETTNKPQLKVVQGTESKKPEMKKAA